MCQYTEKVEICRDGSCNSEVVNGISRKCLGMCDRRADELRRLVPGTPAMPNCPYSQNITREMVRGKRYCDDCFNKAITRSSSPNIERQRKERESAKKSASSQVDSNSSVSSEQQQLPSLASLGLLNFR